MRERNRDSPLFDRRHRRAGKSTNKNKQQQIDI
jgi:hypothetical protein